MCRARLHIGSDHVGVVSGVTVAVWRGSLSLKTSNGITVLRSTGLGRHIEEHQLFADGKGVYSTRRNHLPRRI